MIPDTSDTDKMARIGRRTVLLKARRDAAQKVRDIITIMLNNIDDDFDVSKLPGLVAEIEAINDALELA